MLVGGFGGVSDLPRPSRPPRPSARLVRGAAPQPGRSILLGLDVLIVADIVRTIIVDPTYESAVVSGVIVVVRILLRFALEVEMDGMWSWNPWRREPSNP